MATLRDKTPARPRKVRLLTYILRYEDLLQPESRTYPLDGSAPALRICRAEAAALRDGELRLADPWLSGRHAVIEHHPDLDLLRDEGSANGTYVNGVQVLEHRLADGDLIEAGHSLLGYRVVEEPLAQALLSLDDGLQLGAVSTRCPEVALLLRQLRQIAPARESVLILGETGSGKESAAQTVHLLSGRSGTYRAVDCGAVPENLFESTFFGHQRGAFTGAAASHTGEIVRAHGGTLFLDEVANMGAQAQAKLLRVIETGRVTPVGAAEAQQADVRWLAATNRDLFREEDGFRPDLLRRLSSFVARLPPLRRRREDLGLLSAHLLREAGFPRAAITAAAGRLLFSCAFPGNIRQLRSTLRAAALLAGDGPIDLAHLPEELTQPQRPAADLSTPEHQVPTPAAIEAALLQSGGKVSQAAQALGTYPKQIYRLMERFGLDLDRIREATRRR